MKHETSPCASRSRHPLLPCRPCSEDSHLQPHHPRPQSPIQQSQRSQAQQQQAAQLAVAGAAAAGASGPSRAPRVMQGLAARVVVARQGWGMAWPGAHMRTRRMLLPCAWALGGATWESGWFPRWRLGPVGGAEAAQRVGAVARMAVKQVTQVGCQGAVPRRLRARTARTVMLKSQRRAHC